MVIKVIASRCPQDHPCPSVKVCPTGALVQEGVNAPAVLEEKCIDCGECSDFCPKQALVLHEDPEKGYRDVHGFR